MRVTIDLKGREAVAEFKNLMRWLKLSTNQAVEGLLALGIEEARRRADLQVGSSDVLSFGMTDQERALVDDGRVIQAIKEIRARMSSSLIEAKELTDRYRGRLSSTGVPK